MRAVEMIPETQTTMVPSVEYVTPQIAANWLMQHPKNRNLGKHTLNGYMLSMERGEWKENGETIKFNQNGDLIDGQHRLNAIIKSKKPQWMIIVRGIEDSAIHTLDIGKKRNIADILSMDGYSNTTYLTSAMIVYHAITTDSWRFIFKGRTGRVTVSEMLQVVKSNPELSEHVQYINRISTKNSKLFSVGYAAGLHCFFSKKDPQKANEFFTKFFQGWGMAEGCPILAVRELLKNNMVSIAKFDRHTALAYIVIAWNAFRAGKSNIKFNWDKKVDPMPEIL